MYYSSKWFNGNIRRIAHSLNMIIPEDSFNHPDKKRVFIIQYHKVINNIEDRLEMD